ncbi:MAG: hypothetical protein U9Q78_06635 [Chloroflexota bacterium]|nr:hypothetical protein [Chloroflexota bacterium]
MDSDRRGDSLRLPCWRKIWEMINLPMKVGIFCGLLGAILAAIGLVRGAFEPFSWRGLAMAIILSGGSWGLVSWALTTAVVEAGQDGKTTGEE